MARKSRPAAKRDEHGECMHLYLTRDATCVHCGMRFGLVWSAERDERGWLTGPLRRNLTISIFGFLGAGVGSQTNIPIVFLGMLFFGIFFGVRSLFGTVEAFMKHGFVTGKLGVLVSRGRFSLTASKPAYALVGPAKFPMDVGLYSQFSEGDTLLVEHLRWSRLPVAIYRGHLAR